MLRTNCRSHATAPINDVISRSKSSKGIAATKTQSQPNRTINQSSHSLIDAKSIRISAIGTPLFDPKRRYKMSVKISKQPTSTQNLLVSTKSVMLASIQRRSRTDLKEILLEIGFIKQIRTS